MASVKNPFFSQIDPSVENDLNARTKHFSSSEKSQEDLNYMHRKIPYLRVFSEETTTTLVENPEYLLQLEERRRDRSKEPPQRYVTENVDTVSSFPLASGGFNSQYHGDRNLPGPTLTKATITNKGRYGSTRMATVDFVVFSRSDLDRMSQLFLQPRKKIRIEYGWSQYKNGEYSSTRTGKISGYVYNFNWNLRPEDGGYNCSFEVLGPGSFANGMDANSAPSSMGTITSKDEEGSLFLQGMQGKLIKDIKALQEASGLDREGGAPQISEKAATPQWDTNRGLYTIVSHFGTTIKSQPEKPNENKLNCMVLTTAVGTTNEIPDGDETSTSPEESLKMKNYETFVSLRYIVNVLVNTVLITDAFGKTDLADFAQSDANKDKFYFKCDQFCSLSLLPEVFISADPETVIIPGKYGDYTNSKFNTRRRDFGIKVTAAFGDCEKLDGKSGSTIDTNTIIDFSKILINVQTLFKILDDFSSDPVFPITDFFQKIFDNISECTGGAIKPTIVIPDDIDDKGNQSVEIKVIDTNFTDAYKIDGASVTRDNPPIPYSFKAFTKDSIARNISMDMKLPNKMATALYIGGNKGVTGTEQKVAEFFGVEGAPVESSSSPDILAQSGLKYVWAPWRFESAGRSAANYYWFFNTKQEAEEYFEANQQNLGLNAPDQLLVKANAPIGERVRGSSYRVSEEENKKILNALASEEGSIDSVKAMINMYNTEEEIISNAKKLLRKNCQDGSSSAFFPWNKRILLPINMTVSLDGIEGFKFGNLITSNWLPSKYFDSNQDPKICFCITNITQTITRGDWETSLETQCRINTQQ